MKPRYGAAVYIVESPNGDNHARTRREEPARLHRVHQPAARGLARGVPRGRRPRADRLGGRVRRRQLVLNIGRTWRMGPSPSTSPSGTTPPRAWSESPGERIFTSGEAAQFEEPFKLAARIEAAGGARRAAADRSVPGGRRPRLCRVLPASGRRLARRGPGPSSTSAAPRPGSSSTCWSSASAWPAPHPPGLAVWTLPSYGALETIARELENVAEPLRLVTAALYADLGRQIL